MKNMVYEQGDKRKASSVLHKMINGEHPNLQGFTFDALVSEKYLGQLASETLHQQLSVSTILFEIYGVGWQLLASFWDSLTNLLSHRGHRQQAANEASPQDYINIPLEEQHNKELDTIEVIPCRGKPRFLYPALKTVAPPANNETTNPTVPHPQPQCSSRNNNCERQ
uniref:Uncharacterized protein n=1 Tax=Anopheles minimus TaxID=112268 RepID=A0A182WG79_9DIPT